MSANLEGLGLIWTNGRRATVATLAALFAILALATGANAATYTPNTTDDDLFGSGSQCTADPTAQAEGACSLREAVDAANDNPGDDVIALEGKTYELSPEGITLSIEKADQASRGGKLLIRGTSARQTIVDGNADDEFGTRPFTFEPGANAELRDLSVTGGNGCAENNDCPGFGVGGAIILLHNGEEGRDDPSLLLSRVRVFGNSARDGGAIFNQGKVTLVQSLIDRNVATAYGGGIDNGDELTLANSTISGNEADGSDGPATGDGGGIRNSGFYDEGGTTQAFTKTEIPEEAPFLRADNSTIAFNKASGNGGGVATRVSDGCISALQSVGGCQKGDPGAYAHFHNTIVSDNTADADRNCSGNQPAGSGGETSSEGYNLEDGDSCLFTSTGDKDAASKLGALADNGGGTNTHALAADSAAVNAAESDGCPSVDQRDVARPQDGKCDIGAFERVPDPPQQTAPQQQTPAAQGPRCLDTLPPITDLHREGMRLTRRSLRLSGTSRDQGAPCASGVFRIEVSLARVSGTDLNCRFLRRSNRFVLSPFMNCRQSIRFVARGTTQWAFRFRVALPPGQYRVQARGYDEARNKETPKKRRNIVPFTVR